VYLFLLWGAVACTKKQPDVVTSSISPYPGYKEYLIPANQHYAVDNGFQLVSKKEMHFMALFDSSCIYTNKDVKNFTDINKLYGFSDCGSLHQENSARVGWLWNGNAIELYAYCYTDSVRSDSLLGTAAINTPVELNIGVAAHRYLFTYNGKTITVPRHCTTDSIQGYQLYPYFGGDEAAPHEMHVYIKDL
jgi:hypothetical protein